MLLVAAVAVVVIGVVVFFVMKKKPSGLQGQYKVVNDQWNGTSEGYYYTYKPDEMKILTHKPDKSFHKKSDLLKVSDDKSTLTVDIYDHKLQNDGTVRMTANNDKYEGKYWILEKTNDTLAAAQAWIRGY